MIAPFLGLALGLPAPAPSGDVVAVRAGTIHLVEDGAVIEDGGTILVREGAIVAVGADVDVPGGARVVDYGPDAVIVPGLVCADSSYGANAASPRTAAPSVRAIDNFDPYTPLVSAAKAGVTAVWLAPARGRLVAGHGAVVKTWGGPGDARVVSDAALLAGSITAEARRTRGYWVPPVPATVDVGLGVEQPQLPRTTMGAVVALEELVALARGDEALVAEYGVAAAEGLGAALAEGTPWRMGADSAEEIRALLETFPKLELPLILDGASGAGAVASEIASAGVAVFAAPPWRGGQDFGKGPDAPWPTYDTVSQLADAGVTVAICPPRALGPESLRLAAALARRGGLDETAALRAITLTPAELCGVDDRVGSLAPGKDADFAVLNGPPLDVGSSTLATWIDGEIVWKPKESEKSATVIAVDELHVGDGDVLRPGELLVVGSHIVEVGSRVSRPPGAVVVRGAAAMPGMIDAWGHLGLEGSEKSFSTRFDLTRIVEPGDETDRRVARAGVTTVHLGSRKDGGSSPTLAYHPASSEHDRAVVASPAALRMRWSHQIHAEAGEDVRKELEKAREYVEKWREYEKEIAEWSPEKEEDDDEEDGDDEEDDEEEADEEDDEDGEDEDDDREPSPYATGEWNGTLTRGDRETALRVRLRERSGTVEGTARVTGRVDLIVLEGRREGDDLALRGLAEGGFVDLALVQDENELTGTWTENGEDWAVALERTSDDYPVARRPERPKAEPPAEPKGKPKPPRVDADLEPLRRAMRGEGAIVVEVGREDEILACVAAFEEAGIRPVLWGASGAEKVASTIAGRVQGVITRSGLAALARVGIPITFYSAAEEGAVELPLQALRAVSQGLAPQSALAGLTSDAARTLGLAGRVGRLAKGLDADVLLLDGPPLDPATSVLRVWVAGEEIR